MRPTHRIGVAAGVVALMLSAATVAAQPATVAETIAIHVRDYARARTVLGVPEDFTVEAMAAVGKPGRKEELPEDFQARELPNTRKPLTELVFEGRYRSG